MLTWFETSPDVGPDCLCSWCGQPIEDVLPIRWYDNQSGREARFHNDCHWDYMTIPHITTYIPGPRMGGVPLYPVFHWQDLRFDRVRPAIKSFIDYGAGQGPEPSNVDLEIVRRWFEYIITAPCWYCAGDELVELQQSVKTLQNITQLREWLDQALELGIDPL